jgi:outer membrane protein OmpA-like peptidoglycan-associated protein
MVIVKQNARKANEEISRVLDSVQNSLDSVKVSNEQLTRILKIDEQFKPLQESGLFKYYPDTRKFVAKDLIGQEIFNPNEVVIKPEFKQKTLEVGRVLDNLLRELTANKEFKYQVVIEGNMANTWDKKYNNNLDDSYIASYKRALAVYKLWNDNNIDLRKYGVELLICGSGLNGLDREPIEDNNKRFTIQIIPKVSRPKQTGY